MWFMDAGPDTLILGPSAGRAKPEPKPERQAGYADARGSTEDRVRRCSKKSGCSWSDSNFTNAHLAMHFGQEHGGWDVRLVA
jgi:hypothetical protein